MAEFFSAICDVTKVNVFLPVDSPVMSFRATNNKSLIDVLDVVFLEVFSRDVFVYKSHNNFVLLKLF